MSFSMIRPAVVHQSCKKCGAVLLQSYDELKCPRCGWVDYSYEGEADSEGPSLFANRNGRGSGKERGGPVVTAEGRIVPGYIARYSGDHEHLKGRQINIGLLKSTNTRAMGTGTKLMLVPQCPWCEARMEYIGRMKPRREERFRCVQEHRISLVDRGGQYTWE